jgi:hypothetical protein
MDATTDVCRVAEDMVRCFGDGAYAHLCERAEMAMSFGDRDSAVTWWDIALAVVEIRKIGGSVAGKAGHRVA